MDRSENMRRIRSKDMRPELAVRSLVHQMGYRFRLHRKDLPGKPDMTFASRRKVIFVHGCYWHAHGCKKTHTPKSNLEYWTPKLARNRERDKKNVEALTKLGWSSYIVWECEVGSRSTLEGRIRAFLDANAARRAAQ